MKLLGYKPSTFTKDRQAVLFDIIPEDDRSIFDVAYTRQNAFDGNNVLPPYDNGMLVLKDDEMNIAVVFYCDMGGTTNVPILYVKKEHRGKGFGKKLVTILQSKRKDSLFMICSDAHAVEFWAKLGFEKHPAQLNSVDGIYMFKGEPSDKNEQLMKNFGQYVTGLNEKGVDMLEEQKKISIETDPFVHNICGTTYYLENGHATKLPYIHENPQLWFQVPIEMVRLSVKLNSPMGSE